jgi:conserved oligomeric Golgi complex subunit 6
MQKILSTMVDPAVKMLLSSAEEKEEKERRKGRVWDKKVFVLNGLTYILVRSMLPSLSSRSRLLIAQRV